MRLALFLTGHLHRRGGAQGRVKSHVIGFAMGGLSLDVAAALALGAGAGTPPALLAGELVQRGIEFAGVELLPGLDFLAALPPVGVAILGGGLRLELRLAGRLLGGDLLSAFAYGLLFFSAAGSSPVLG
jgi:hypothetical protein